jgi:signal recognition particle GTPase
MEKQDLLISANCQQVLFYASTDKELTANQFRVLFYICTHLENVYIEEMKDKLNIKTNNSIADFIKVLIKNKYITRVRNKRLIKKGVPFYSYVINEEKPLLPFNVNSYFSDSYFSNIDELFAYFFKKIPTNKKIDISVSRKQLELLLYKDDFSIETIKKVIDFISKTKYKDEITRPILLRRNFKKILNELTQLELLESTNKPTS